jgi:hypothetical protein
MRIIRARRAAVCVIRLGTAAARRTIQRSLAALAAGIMAAALSAGVPAAAVAAHPATPSNPIRAIGVSRAATGSGDTDLYVDNATQTCSDSGSGTQTQPFCTIAAAAAAVQPGQTVVVEAGNFYAGATISVSGVTFLAANGTDGYDSAVRVGGSIVVSGVQNVVVSGFSVTGPQPFLVDNSSNITINGGAADAALASPAVEVTGTSSNVTISRMSITGLTGVVTIGQGVTGAVVTTNTIMVFDANAPPSPRTGVLVTDAPGTEVVSNTLVTNCQTAVTVTGTSPGTILENNIAETGSAPANNPSACTDPANAVGFSVSAASTPQTVADYNVIDPVSTGPLYDWGGTNYTTLASFTAATGQGTHDIGADPDLGSPPRNTQVPFWFAFTQDSPAIDSADANAPGELPSDQLGNARADDPSVPNTGTGTGYFDRGAWELDNGIEFEPLTDQPDQAGGPFDLTLSSPMNSTWTTNGPVGTYVFSFSDEPLPVVTSASSVNHTFATAGPHEVGVIESADGFPSSYFSSVNQSVVVGADYTPVTPTRIMDTRVGLGVAKGAVAAHGDLTLQIPSVGGVSPADSAVVVNVTVTGPAARGALTVFNQSGAGAATSNINFGAGQTIANMVTIEPINGAIMFQNNSGGSVQVFADLEGYYSSSGSGFQGVAPVRVLDTRNGTGITAAGPVAAHGTLRLNLSGRLPAGAAAAVLNLTVTQPRDNGLIVAYADGQPLPGTSNLNFGPGQTVPNQVIVPLTNDIADFYNESSGTVQLVGDLAGYYAAGAPDSFVPYGPTRIVDTRTGLGTFMPPAAIPGHETLVINADIFYGGCSPYCPVDTADLFNVTVTQPKATGFLTVYAYGTDRPGTSNVNFTAGQTAANLVTVQDMGPDIDTIGIYNGSGSSVEIVVDEQGYFINQQ